MCYLQNIPLPISSKHSGSSCGFCVNALRVYSKRPKCQTTLRNCHARDIFLWWKNLVDLLLGERSTWRQWRWLEMLGRRCRTTWLVKRSTPWRWVLGPKSPGTGKVGRSLHEDDLFFVPNVGGETSNILVMFYRLSIGESWGNDSIWGAYCSIRLKLGCLYRYVCQVCVPNRIHVWYIYTWHKEQPNVI